MSRTYQFTALTDIWTGDVDTARTKKAERLIPTGLLGSIRWWFEVLVRGLGGSACDPTADSKGCQGREHCVVCELFGCTGWARKFRFDVLAEDGQIQRHQIKTPTTFVLRLTPLRHVCQEEWALLEATLRLLADFGAIGGKTIYKPTDEQHRKHEPHHQDYGLVKLVKIDPESPTIPRNSLHAYARSFRVVTGPAWASLEQFWFVGSRSLSRIDATTSTFNRVLGREESKTCRDCGESHDPPGKCPQTRKHPHRHSELLGRQGDGASKWLAGGIAESKKVFSFKGRRRTFGFVNPGVITQTQLCERLRSAWPDLGENEVIRGLEVLNRLFANAPSMEEQ